MSRSLLRLLVLVLMLPLAAQAATPLPVLAVSMERKPAGTFYVSGAIQGYGEINLLVDTGSSLVVINDEMLAQLQQANAAQYSRELGGNMADGTYRPVHVYKISALRIGADCWIHDVEAAVLPTTARAILGMNVLTRLSPFTFSAEPPQLTLNQCSAAPETAVRKRAAAPQIARE